MSVWREVQEALYRRWMTYWVKPTPGIGPLTPFTLGNEKFTPFDEPWASVLIQRLPGGAGTMGRPGNRKMDRAGLVIIVLREPPGDGVGRISDLAEQAAAIFENRRLLDTHDIRFATVEPGTAGEMDKGRWWGVSIEARFDYEDLR